jgi:hypothetical protein
LLVLLLLIHYFSTALRNYVYFTPRTLHKTNRQVGRKSDSIREPGHSKTHFRRFAPRAPLRKYTFQ